MADLQVVVELVGKDNLSGAFSNARKGVGSVVDGFAKFGLAATGVQTAIGTVTSTVSALIGPAMEAQQVGAQLNAVLTSTKGAAGVTAEAVTGLSTSLSKVTTFEDDAITSAQSLLLTFTNIGGSVFPQATETVLNMSTALGQDLSASAMQVGKALNDPVQGVTALRRVGVQLTDAQEELVKQMVATGDVAGAQAVILGELQTEFGGAAQAAGQTFAGQLAIAQNQLGEVQESIGAALIPVLTKFLQALMPLIDAFAQWLPAALETAQPLLDAIAEHADQLIIPAIVAIGTATVAAGAAMVIALGPVVLAIGAVGLAATALTLLWTSNWGDIQGKTEAVWGVIQPIFAAIGAAFEFLGTVVLPTFGAAWATTWETAQVVFNTVWTAVQAIIQAIWPIVEGIILVGIALVQGNWTEAWNGILKVFQDTWNLINGIVAGLVQTILGALQQLATDALNAAKSVGEAIVNGIKDAIGNLGGQIKDALLGQINSALDAAKTAIGNFRPPSIPMPTVQLPGHGAGPEVTGGDFGPAPASQGAIDWATQRLGQAGWAGWCERFVENAFGTSGRYASAWAAAQAMMTNPGGSMANAPRGTIMYFRPDASNGMFGHVGISLGNGTMISATSQGPQITGVNNYWQSLYAGYGPPRFAGGVRDFGGGLAVVGERGWELAALPRGTDVYSHRESQGLLAGAGGVNIHFHGPVYGFDEFEDRVVQANERAARRGRQ